MLAPHLTSAACRVCLRRRDGTPAEIGAPHISVPHRCKFQDILAMLSTPGKSGAGVDRKSVRLDARLIVWARVLAIGFGALIARLQ
jgi:hypothetical protein